MTIEKRGLSDMSISEFRLTGQTISRDREAVPRQSLRIYQVSLSGAAMIRDVTLLDELSTKQGFDLLGRNRIRASRAVHCRAQSGATRKEAALNAARRDLCCESRGDRRLQRIMSHLEVKASQAEAPLPRTTARAPPALAASVCHPLC